MAFSGSTYVQVTGATTAAAGQTIQSAVWNNIHNDLGNALTQIMQQLVASPSQRNLLWMNGGLEVWQRGSDSTSNFSVGASSTAYTADRWYLATGANEASTVAAVTGLTTQSRLAARVRRTAAQTGTAVMVFAYPLDTDEVFRMRGKIVTLSFVVQAGANWSPTNGTLTAVLYTGTGAAPAKRSSTPYTGEVAVINTGTNLTAGGAVVSVSLNSSAIQTTITQAELQFAWTPTGTAGAADDITIDDVQLEVQNSVGTWTPTSYDRLDFKTMLEGCKRHYQKTFPLTVFASQGAGRNNALEVVSNAASRVGIWWEYPVEMRATPANVLSFNPDGASANWQNITAAASSAVSFDTSITGTKAVYVFSATAGATDQFFLIHLSVDAGI